MQDTATERAALNRPSGREDEVPIEAKMEPARSTSNKRQKVKSKKVANALVPALSVDFGSLNPHTKTRIRHISQQATKADNSNLGLFTKKDTLTSSDQQNITAALDRSSIYRMGPRDMDRGQNMDEAPMLKV